MCSLKDVAFSPITLSQQSFLEGISYLTSVDSDLAQIIVDLGNPPLWSRQPGFPTMIHIILEQQVSLASARATFNKLHESVGEITPEHFLELTDVECTPKWHSGFERTQQPG